MTNHELNYIRGDNDDFTELRYELQTTKENKNELVQTAVSEFYDIQRQLTIEKGEERYYYLHDKKKREYRGNIESGFKKEMIQEDLFYYKLEASRKLDKRLKEDIQFAGREWNVDGLAETHERQDKIRNQKKQQKLLGFKFELTPSYWKRKLLTAMATIDKYNPEMNKQYPFYSEKQPEEPE